MSNKIQQIKQFAVYVDQTKNGGNGNKFVDGSEIEIFKKKVKTLDKNIDVDKILADYTNNKVQYESEYDLNGTNSESSVETAVIAALNENTALKNNDKNVKTASTIAAGIKSSDEDFVWWNPTTWFNDNGDAELLSPSTWFNNEEELLTYSDMIDKNNVLEVVEDGDAVSKVAEADDDVRAQAGSTIISALVEAANERQIDVSGIVAEKDGKYVVGREVAGKEFGSEVTDEENFEAVVNALKKAVNNGQNTVTNKNNQKEQMLTMWAKKIDSAEFGGNGNGYIDTPEETAQLKQIAAQYGYDINTVLEEIRDNDVNGVDNTTSMQKTVFNIFDPEQRAALNAQEEGKAKDVSKAIADGIGDGDNEITDFFAGIWDSVANTVSGWFDGTQVKTVDGNQELLDEAIKNVDSSNVMTILNDSKNADLIDKLVNKYDHNWFLNLVGMSDTSSDYTSPILSALYEAAQQNGVEVDDIVMVNGDKFITGSAVNGVRVGSDALDSDNISKVVSALKERINKVQA